MLIIEKIKLLHKICPMLKQTPESTIKFLTWVDEVIIVFDLFWQQSTYGFTGTIYMYMFVYANF